MTRQIEIHEFSTGIVIETKADGSWFSRGFTGRYMNCTFDPIPDPIQEAISNRLFAIAEGASSDTPAMIGREVGSQGEIWSVVAVVTKARDESRSFSAYRYFCVKGKGDLHKILRFLRENPLQFNPLDKKTIGNPHFFIDNHETKIPLDNFQDLFSESTPVIVPFHRNCNPTIINAITEEMAGENMTAWAYNVQALDKPASFYVIKPHDEKAEAIIRKSLSNQVITNRPIFDEQKIKTAVTSLCKRNKIKVEYIKTLEEALSNPDINDTFWQSIFDGQGLKQAKSQGIYNDEMTRLFTLQGLILLRTLPDFLTWIKDIKRDDLLTISNKFQYDILKILTHEFPSKFIVEKIELGVILIIPYLFKDESLIEQIIGLLKTNKSLWGYFYINSISQKIDHDLKLMKNYAKQKDIDDDFQIFNDESWEGIKDELAIAWRVPPHYQRFKPIPEYKIWVRLFDGLNESKLALFFAHFAYDKVPKDIFSKVTKVRFGSHYHYKIYDVITTREVGKIEQFILGLDDLLNKEIDMKLWKIIILVIVCGLGGFLLRAYLFPSELEKSADTFFKNNIQNTQDLSLKSLTKSNEVKKTMADILDDKDKNAKLIASVISCSKLNEECQVNNPAIKLIEKASEEENFSKTAKNIISLIDELAKDDSNNKQKYINSLKETLGNNNLDYSALSDVNKQNIRTNSFLPEEIRKIWVKAIYVYQAKNIDKGIQPDGIINAEGKTRELLKDNLSK